MHYRDHFRGKRVTLMGLGLLGRGVNVARFLASCGAALTVTDLKSAEQLAASVKKLARFKNIRFVLGGHRLEDFSPERCDLVIKAAGVPLDSTFVAEARRRGVPVAMDASLFAELAPRGVALVGVTGTRGKSTTTHLIHAILSEWFSARGSRAARSSAPRVFLGGNVRGAATLPLLRKARPGDVAALELDSWQLQGFGDARRSPDIAVFTTFYDDHLNYYRGDRGRYLADKANIFLFQGDGLRGERLGVETPVANAKPSSREPTLIVGEQAAPLIRAKYPAHARRATVGRAADLPRAWRLKIPGEHNRANAACAAAAARALGVPEAVIRRAVEKFPGLPGRLEYLRSGRGVKVYNDNNATTPEATIAALRALAGSASRGARRAKRIVLIMGGADKGLDMSGLFEAIERYCKAVALLSGSGTERIVNDELEGKEGDPARPSTLTARSFLHDAPVCGDLRSAIRRAFALAKRGDIILFSPAFASFGMFKNEYDRNDRFVRLARAAASSRAPRRRGRTSPRASRQPPRAA